jgi:protein arginine kinase activator
VGGESYSEGVKCEKCDKEAVVHEVTVRNGVRVEKHLCEACAAGLGIGTPPSAPIEELMSKILLAPGSAGGAAQQRGAACPSCKMTFVEFRQGGLLGCPECYGAFEAQLTPLVERAHEGGTQHAGKSPRRASGQGGDAAQLAALAERAERLRRLQEDLKHAVVKEDYERAARLRDEMRQLAPGQSPEGPSGGAG